MCVGFALTRASVSVVGSAETKCTPLTALSPSPPTPTAVGSGPMCVGGGGDGRGIPCSWRPVNGTLRTPTSVFRCVAARPQLHSRQGNQSPEHLLEWDMFHMLPLFLLFFWRPEQPNNIVTTASAHSTLSPDSWLLGVVGKRSRGGPGGHTVCNVKRSRSLGVRHPCRGSSSRTLQKTPAPGKEPSVGLELDAKVSSDLPRLKLSWACGGVRSPKTLV